MTLPLRWLVAQMITGIVLWRLTASHPVVAATPA